ncbi:unnamed protein product [Mytilus coruscus]|uniref:TRIM2_3 n=1 Tax=Mytilus coruscus TaxID=42192 RepID=A0A6J8C034_MYTCO|nr:unnamed protein product [Mytilus coruscus]
MKQLENTVSCKNIFLQSLIDKDSLKESELSYHAHTVIQNFVTGMEKFGDVTIAKKPCDVILTRRKDKQAQKVVPHVSNRSVENINLKVHTTVNTMGDQTWGCYTLLDGRMAFTFYNSKTVWVFKTDGSKDFEVKTPIFPFDISYISENNTLAVTTVQSERKCITVIDIQNKEIITEIQVESYYYGITVKENKFICSVAKNGIKMINPYKNSISDLVRDNLHCYETNSVICSDMQGIVQWTFKIESVLTGPRGISVDNDGNVYAVGKASNNVVVRSDGQQHKEILTASDGLSNPNALDYCKSTNQLLVANFSNSAMILL